jgi:hypothetical protein
MNMIRTTLYFKCMGAFKRLFIKGDPGLKKYACVDSILYCRLKNSLYRCIHASMSALKVSRTDSLHADSVHR